MTLVIAEYPGPNWKGHRLYNFFVRPARIPLLFITTGHRKRTYRRNCLRTVRSTTFEQEHLAQLPMTVRRILNEQELRVELEEAGRPCGIRNRCIARWWTIPAYGICRCDAKGKFLDVNQALVAMLGYASREELLVANHASEIVLDFGSATPLVDRSDERLRIEPVEMDWKRKNGLL